MKSIDANRFRQLLGSFATGVSVVTARLADGRPAGMTASAIAAVSLEPPLLLVCVWRESDFHVVMEHADRFAINVLAEHQEEHSRRFAAEIPDRFADVAWEPHATGVPLLDAVSAHIVCARRGAHAAGDHTIFIGEVVDGAVYAADPLLHVHGAYRRLR